MLHNLVHYQRSDQRKPKGATTRVKTDSVRDKSGEGGGEGGSRERATREFKTGTDGP